jgi:hypothetical protein
MAFRFQKRIKLMPGITLNLSRKGVSTSLGPRGAKVTLGHGQTRVTTGLPGSGISHTTITKNKPQRLLAEQPRPPLRKPSANAYKFGQLMSKFWKRVFGGI